jgi:hypothetical protein
MEKSKNLIIVGGACLGGIILAGFIWNYFKGVKEDEREGKMIGRNEDIVEEIKDRIKEGGLWAWIMKLENLENFLIHKSRFFIHRKYNL